MISSTVYGLLLVAGSAVARTGTLGPTNNYVAPSGLQAVTLNVNVNCTAYYKISAIASTLFSFVIGGSLADGVGPSGGFYFNGRVVGTGTQVFTNGLITAGVSDFKQLAGVKNSANITATGATQSTYDIANYNNFVVPFYNVTKGKLIVLNIPASGSPFKIGPIKPASGSSKVSLSVGGLLLNVNATVFGSPLPIQLSCPPTKAPAYIAYVPVGGSSSATVDPKLDLAPVQTLPAQSSISSAGFNYTCTATGVSGSVVLPISYTVFSPAVNVTRSKTFTLANGHGTVNVSAATITKLNALLTTKATAFSLTVTSISSSGTGISPTTVSLFSGSSTSDTTTISSSKSVYSVDIPGKNGLFPNVTYTAQASAGTAYLTYGKAAIAINALSSSGSVLKSFAFSCAPPTAPAAPLLAISVI